MLGITQCYAVANPSVATEIPDREYAVPQGEETRPKLTTSAFFVSPSVPARVSGGRCLAPNVSSLSRRPIPSGRYELESRRLRAKSHLSLAPNWGYANRRFEFGQRTEMPCLDLGSEPVSSAGRRTDNRPDRRRIAAWLRRTQNVDASAPFRRGDSMC